MAGAIDRINGPGWTRQYRWASSIVSSGTWRSGKCSFTMRLLGRATMVSGVGLTCGYSWASHSGDAARSMNSASGWAIRSPEIWASPGKETSAGCKPAAARPKAAEARSGGSVISVGRAVWPGSPQ